MYYQATELKKFRLLVREIARLAGVNQTLARVLAVGHLELLWHCTMRATRRGNIGELDDVEIADAIGWDGDPEAIVEALVKTGWIDRHPEHRLVVHDWHEHAPNFLKKNIGRAGGFVTKQQVVTGGHEVVTGSFWPENGVDTGGHDHPRPAERDEATFRVAKATFRVASSDCGITESPEEVGPGLSPDDGDLAETACGQKPSSGEEEIASSEEEMPDSEPVCDPIRNTTKHNINERTETGRSSEEFVFRWGSGKTWSPTVAELADLQRKLPEMDVPREVRALALWADGQRERSGPLQWLAATLVNKLASGKYLPRQPTRQWAALTRTPQREFELAEFEIRRRARQFGWAADEVERRLRSVRQRIESQSGRALAVC